MPGLDNVKLPNSTFDAAPTVVYVANASPPHDLLGLELLLGRNVRLRAICFLLALLPFNGRRLPSHVCFLLHSKIDGPELHLKLRLIFHFEKTYSPLIKVLISELSTLVKYPLNQQSELTIPPRVSSRP